MRRQRDLSLVRCRWSGACAACLTGLVALMTLSACGAARLQGSEYRDAEAHYHIGPVGPTWRRLDAPGDNDLAWHDEAAGAVIQVNATCDPGADVPLTVLTNHLLAGFTEREITEQSVIAMDGREALRTHATARLDGVPREMLFYVMKKDECVYDFALVTPGGDSFGRALASFEPFVSGFRTEGAPEGAAHGVEGP